MRIQNMFAKGIDRPINGVVKVNQDELDILVQELDEYVITRELKKHIITFFNNYLESFNAPTADIGVWISGFFGSGKSHFLKMLSYLLQNREVNGVRTVERFRHKPELADDPATFMLIDRATRSGHTDTILFNIDIEGSIKISKQNIPAATQLFTPDWIVHYMVENSLGRLWVEGHPSAQEKYLPAHNADGSVHVEEGKWNYYLEEAEQEPEVQAQLAEIRKQYAALKPEDILTIDPCAGPGHILCVLFDMLVNIYEDYGYTAREAAVSIVQNNLWGLDIDDRAAQLAYFAVMMKARQYDRRFFSKGVQPHVYAIQESNSINREHLNYLGRGLSDIERNNAVNQMNTLLDEFIDAKEYGSILQPREYDWAMLSRFVEDTTPMQQMTFGEAGLDATQAELRIMIAQGQALTQKYHAVVTNPPYMGASGMGAKLAEYVKAAYPDSKSDLFAVFIERIRYMLANNGYQAMITQHAWMFLSSFEKLRAKLQTIDTVNMAHLRARAFEEIGGEVVQTTSFVLRNSHIAAYKGTYCRLIDPTTQQGKEDMCLSSKNRYTAQQDNFSKIPGAPVAYWVSEAFLNAFKYNLGDVCEIKKGSDTGENDRYVRLWYEVDKSKVSFINHNKKWIVYLKGGEARKWYGHLTFVVNWENDGYEIRHDPRSTIRNQSYFYMEGITWSDVGSNGSTFRYFPKDCLRDNRGPAIFAKNLYYVLGLLNSCVCDEAQKIVNPTICFQAGSAKALPYKQENENQVESIISISETRMVEHVRKMEPP